MDHNHIEHNADPKGFWGSRYSIGLIVLGAVAGYFLITEHRAHVLGALPYLLLAACPLMHSFMHGGHGGHGGHGHQHGAPQTPQDSSGPAQAPGTGEKS